MKRGKILYKTNFKDYKSVGVDVDFSIYGIFNTETVFWNYYVISSISCVSGFKLTKDICSCSTSYVAGQDDISRYGKDFKTKEEGILYIHEFKDKWEYGSNDTRQEKRDKKLDDLLDDEK